MSYIDMGIWRGFNLLRTVFILFIVVLSMVLHMYWIYFHMEKENGEKRGEGRREKGMR